MKKYLFLILFVSCYLTSFTQSTAVPFTLEDRDRIMRTELELKSLRNEMSSEIKSLRNEMNTKFESQQMQINDFRIRAGPVSNRSLIRSVGIDQIFVRVNPGHDGRIFKTQRKISQFKRIDPPQAKQKGVLVAIPVGEKSATFEFIQKHRSIKFKTWPYQVFDID